MNGLIENVKGYLPSAWTSTGAIVPVLRFSGAIGVVTAFFGAPFFAILLRTSKGFT